MSQYSRAQLRDVLVEFYTRVDPSRLDAGIDVNGMIDWIIYHGPEDMNARLQAKYGSSLDFEILKQPKNNQQSALHRISMMPNTQLIEQQSKRLELRAKVEQFYAANDPGKLNTIDTFVEWIEVNGEKAFNDLLMKKYGKVMVVATRERPEMPQPPPAVVEAMAAAAPPAAAPPVPPPRVEKPPPQPTVDPDLVDRLNKFYAFHEPDQPNDPMPIAEWGMQVGYQVLNEKLMQLYGGNLDTLEDDEEQALNPPPPPPPPPEDEEDYQEDMRPPSMMAPTVEVVEEPIVVVVEEPPPAPPPQPVMPVKPTPPVAPVIVLTPPTPAPPAPVVTRPTPVKPPAPVLAPPVRPVMPQLPVIPTLKSTTTTTTPNNKPPPPKTTTTIKGPAPSLSQQLASATANKQPVPPTQQRKRRPSEGACDRYQLDLSGDGFGVCLCGFVRAQHSKTTAPASTTTTPSKPPVRRPSMAQNVMGKHPQPCEQYRVDLSGKNFGDCTCGWGKSDHASSTAVLKAPPPAAKVPPPVSTFTVPSVPQQRKASDLTANSNAIVEHMFDFNTLQVYVMMVSSYKAQHGSDPDEDQMIEWASNLVILTVGKEMGPGSMKLKVRAKAVPKKKM